MSTPESKPVKKNSLFEINLSAATKEAASKALNPSLIDSKESNSQNFTQSITIASPSFNLKKKALPLPVSFRVPASAKQAALKIHEQHQLQNPGVKISQSDIFEAIFIKGLEEILK